MTIERIEAGSLNKKEAEKYVVQIAQQYIRQPVKKVTYLGGGTFGRAYGTEFADGKKIVIKFLLTGNMLEKEVHDLKLLAANCTVKIPEVLFARKADADIPVDCYGMEKIDGKNALTAFGMLFLCKRRREQFADEVTSALHEIHCRKSDRFGDTLAPVYADWTDYYKPFAEKVLDKAEDMYRAKALSEKIIRAMRAAWDKFDVIFSEKVGEACLIHGDLNVANIMVGESYGVTGFIDPLDTMYADREYDLFQFDNLTGKRFYLRETYMRKYGASKFCDAKCAFYGLWNEMYCYIKSGVLVNFIVNPLVRNIHKILAGL